MMTLSSSNFLCVFFFCIIYSGVVWSYETISEDGKNNYYQLDLPGVIGPESIAFDCGGNGPYVGVSDGRILKWQGSELRWTEFAFTSSSRQRKSCEGSTDPKMEPTCGRPLGLKFNSATCDLYIADAYFGLMVVGSNGGQAQPLVNSAEGVPFRFTNALDIDTNNGIIYFTDSSIIFQRREYVMQVITGDKTGRLLKYDIKSKMVTVLYKGLAFPNGVALSKDNSFLVLVESITLRVLKFWLHETNNSTPEILAQLQRFPDNIKRNNKGEFWIALNSLRGRIQKYEKTNLLNERSRSSWFTEDDYVGVKIDENGNILKTIDGHGGHALESVSEVEEHGESLYIGSSVEPYVGVIKV